jgi:hypothetical protein
MPGVALEPRGIAEKGDHCIPETSMTNPSWRAAVSEAQQ